MRGPKAAYIAYVLFVTILACYPLLTLRGNDLYVAFDEYRWVEDLQWAHLAVALIAQAILVGWARRRPPELRLIDWMGSFLVASMLLRELNNFWPEKGLDTHYHAAMGGLLLATAACGVRLLIERRRTGTRLFAGPPQSWIRLYLLGFGGYIAANIFSRMVRNAVAERVYRRVLEEGLELLFGTLFLIGGVEALLAVIEYRRRRR